jgi:nifR3 family TIM-barrel protein
LSNFYQKLKKPILALAPMSGVTDEAFRRMLLKLGRPDIFWTEFVSVDGLFSSGREELLHDLKFIKKEKPIVAQVFGAKPELFEKAARLIKKLGFDGIDINMGCPNHEIEKIGAGAALINNSKLAAQIIRAAKKTGLPVSVKTRVGYKIETIDDWIPALLAEKPAALIVHFRTRSAMFKGQANWALAKPIIKLRDKISPQTLIFGNGDVKSREEAEKLARESGLDGVMVGRGVLQNPWFFSDTSARVSVPAGPTPPQRLAAVIKHAKLFEKLNQHKLDKNGKLKNFSSIKKFFKSYCSGFSGAKDLRESLMLAKSATEVKKIIKTFR